jgi:23S rRNA (uracil1939-C5)-methyltransferase
VYVDFAIPGERADLKIPKRRKGYSVGFLEQVIEPSVYRMAPICKHFEYCGGCARRYIGYEYRLEPKRRILVNALEKYETETPQVPLTIASPRRQFYRNKLEYAFSIADSEPVIGFHAINRFDGVLRIDECFLQPEPSRKIVETAKALAIEMNIPFYNRKNGSGALRSLTVRASATNKAMAIAGFTPNGVNPRIPYLTSPRRLLPEITSLYFCRLDTFSSSYASGNSALFSGTMRLQEKLENVSFRLSPKSFFQPNGERAFHIYQTIVDKADFKRTDLVYDLYTGVGSMACFIASYVANVIGIEGTPEAISDAFSNAKSNGMENAEFVVGDILKTFKPRFIERYAKPDVVILDPPRSGALIEIKRTVVEAAPRKIIYLGCNPVSLAFDLKMLTNGYRASRVRPFDMFPRAHHAETPAILDRC